MKASTVAMLLVTVLVTSGAWAQEEIVPTGRITKVLVEGDPVPGMEGLRVDGIGTPRLAGDGHVAFTGKISGPGVTSEDDGVLWFGLPGQLSPVLREGQSFDALGAGVAISSPYSNHLQLNDFGTMTGVFSVSGPGIDSGNDSVFWHWQGGQLTALLQEGTEVPAVGKVYTASMPFHPPLSDTGQSVFTANYASGDYPDVATVLASPIGQQVVVRTDTPAPGASGGLFWLTHARLNTAGQLVVSGSMHDNGVQDTNDTALWIGGPDSLQMVVREGDTAPGIPGGTFGAVPDPNYVTGGFYVSDFNNAGQVMFFAPVMTPGGSSTGLWLVDAGGRVQNVLAHGKAAPGTQAGVTFTSFHGGPSVTPGGRAAFYAGLEGPGVTDKNNRGLWMGLPGDLKLVAREGEAVPGFEDLEFVSVGLNSPAANDLEMLAFEATIGSDSLGSKREALLAWDSRQEMLHLLLMQGQEIDVDPTDTEDLRTVSHIFSFLQESNGQDGSRQSFNSLAGGTLGVRVRFTDGEEGVFLISPPVPEPASLSLLLIGSVALISGRSSRRQH